MELIPRSGADSQQLRKALEWELSLDSGDLRSHAWYHGSIPRSRADEILERDGDFLVRDCTSQPGNYVLSTRCKGQNLHFVINKVVLQPGTVYERIQFQFEDEAYDTVSDLITYYVGSGKVVSALSGAKIQNPKNRFFPLSFYAAKYAAQRTAYSGYASPYGESKYNGINATGGQTLQWQSRPELPPELPGKRRSLSLTPAELNEKFQFSHSQREKIRSGEGVVSDAKSAPLVFATHSLTRGTAKRSAPIKDPGVNRHSEGNVFPRIKNCESECASDLLKSGTPPKGTTGVSSLPAEADNAGDDGLPCSGAISSYQTFGSDSGNGSSDSGQSSAAGDSYDASACSGSGPTPSGVVIKNPKYGDDSSAMIASASSVTLKALDYEIASENLLVECAFDNLPSSIFDLENFQTLLLPTVENKPVDQTALQCVKNMLRENGSKILAIHLTKVDLEIMLKNKIKGENDQKMFTGISSGIELCALPQGQQIRLDIIERAECLKLLVAVTVLTCMSAVERAETLHKWIQVAIDIKTALGNLFGFSAVMLGLCLPQVQRLNKTWHILRQKFTDSAFTYEAKLRPILKSMNECTNPQAPNTTIPHILPFVWLQDLTLDDILGKSEDAASKVIINADGTSIFEAASDSGLSMLFAHLESGRKFAEMIPFYRKNAEIILGDSKIDDLILDMFRTEFHMKFLWGSRGATVGCQERRAKFYEILSVMSEKCEPSPLENSP